MIKLKTITGRDFYLNNNLIYRVDEKIDTIITLVDGKTIRVRESAEEVRQKIIEFQQEIMYPMKRKELE
ncbi:hypothetical protein BW727_101879 [Jeotgalibaca dankookensis]|uniref:Flagellar protein FlbD n=1 Tax=Jeotgalibaca dankookensis TaxID=708126 RepID=A0A1S6IRL9_9LACT|nr:flagellar FlbD family protein [Jeotgalibaca dankookensis]AQS54203.1 hypothetical protein BW727_101879 [Jeotgalibaca dankookensis]